MVGHGRERRLRGQAAEYPVDQLAGRRRIDIADNADGECVARKHVAHIGAQIGGRHRSKRLRRAVAGPAIGMVGERLGPPAPVGDLVRVGGAAHELRLRLVADAFERLGVETRRGQRKVEQLHGVIEVGGERPQGAAELIASGREAEMDRLLLDQLLEGARIEVARTLIEHGADHVGDARLVGGVGIGAAGEGVVERQHRNGTVTHEPCLDAAGRDDLLDLACRAYGAKSCERQCDAERRREKPAHDFFSSRGAPSRMR